MGYFFRYDSICMKNWDLKFVGYEYWDYEMNLMRHWGLTNRNTTSHPDLETHGGMGGESYRERMNIPFDENINMIIEDGHVSYVEKPSIDHQYVNRINRIC